MKLANKSHDVVKTAKMFNLFYLSKLASICKSDAPNYVHSSIFVDTTSRYVLSLILESGKCDYVRINAHKKSNAAAQGLY